MSKNPQNTSKRPDAITYRRTACMFVIEHLRGLVLRSPLSLSLACSSLVMASGMPYRATSHKVTILFNRFVLAPKLGPHYTFGRKLGLVPTVSWGRESGPLLRIANKENSATPSAEDRGMVGRARPYDSGSARRALPILSPCRAVG